MANIVELRGDCVKSLVMMIACQMTADLFDFKKKDFIDEIEFGGAATFFKFVGESDMNLFIFAVIFCFS